jgi:CBS domain-containing protein
MLINLEKNLLIHNPIHKSLIKIILREISVILFETILLYFRKLQLFRGVLKNMSSSVLIRDLMSRNMKTVRPDSKLREVIEKMVKFHIGSIIVVQGDKPIGIITERDALRCLTESRFDLEVAEAKDIMSGPLVTISEDEDIEQASRLMINNNIKKLPVVMEGKLVGIVTSSDIVRGTDMLTDTLKDIYKIGRDN